MVVKGVSRFKVGVKREDEMREWLRESKQNKRPELGFHESGHSVALRTIYN